MTWYHVWRRSPDGYVDSSASVYETGFHITDSGWMDEQPVAFEVLLTTQDWQEAYHRIIHERAKTELVEKLTKNKLEAVEIGFGHGYDHANFVNAYGGELKADDEVEVPGQYEDSAMYYKAAYLDGQEAYGDEQDEED